MSELGSIGAWVWRRHGEELQRGRGKEGYLSRLIAQAKADAFEETGKYIDTVQQAREDHGEEGV